MKNIHILSANKPSRLGFIYESNQYHIINGKDDFLDNLSIDKNIYITSDEEIKEGDWCLEYDDIDKKWLTPYKPTNENWDMVSKANYCRLKGTVKKIILTTDQELIKDGIQEIDDEFLEWFVKNPSCDNVEVVDGIYFDDVEWISCYKIIIPKEETKPKTMLENLQEYLKNTPKEKVLEDWNEFQHLDDEGITVNEFLDNQKQETFVNEKCSKCGRNQYSSRKPFCTDDFCNKDFYQKPKQETLEEVAKDFIENTMKFSFISNDTKTQANRMFKCVEFGAKWQQEQNKNLYSEEEVKAILFHRETHYIETGHHLHIEEWFEQFKK